MEYNEYSFEKIKELIAEGQAASNKYDSLEDLIYSKDYSLSAFEYIELGYDNPDWKIGDIETYYRIGEPIIDELAGKYKSSYNYADDRPECGVSVITTKWLHSFKSIFFGTSDEDLQRRGVYKITGFALPSTGGDDELLVKPLDWAVKTRIRTRDGLERAVARQNKKDSEVQGSGR